MPEDIQPKSVEVTTSKRFTIDWRDAGKGLVMAVIGAGLTALQNSIETGHINWKAVGTVSLTAGVGYLLKNFFEPPKTVVTITPPVKELS